MKPFGRYGGTAVAVAAAGLLCLAGNGQDEAAQVLRNFRLPDYDESGNLRAQVFGDEARVLPDGLVAITNLRIELYEAGEVSVTMRAGSCLFDRRRQRAWSDAEVRVERADVVLTGKGFLWIAERQQVHILDQTQVEVRGLKGLTLGWEG